MEDALRQLINEQFDQVKGSLGDIRVQLIEMNNKLDETTEKTILNSAAIEYAREEIQGTRDTQGRCAQYCEKNRDEMRAGLKEYADNAAKEKVQSVKIWVLTAVVTGLGGLALGILGQLVK